MSHSLDICLTFGNKISVFRHHDGTTVTKTFQAAVNPSPRATRRSLRPLWLKHESPSNDPSADHVSHRIEMSHFLRVVNGTMPVLLAIESILHQIRFLAEVNLLSVGK